MTPPENRDASPADLVEAALLAVVVAAAAVAVLFLSLSKAAAALFGHGPFPAHIDDALVALGRLPRHWSDPAQAWPAKLAPALPGPVAYWFVLGAPVLGLAVLATICLRMVIRHQQRRRRPLGVDPDSGVAPRLRRLEVPAPVAGRITLGHIGERLVATEPAASLAVVGPSGCGKTSGFAIPALLEWDGPVVATSVKTDLLGATFAARRAVGSVWIYDPTACTPFPAARWSPLPACVTWAGAQRVAAWLCEAAETKRSSVTDADYWQSQAQIALAPHLHAAATSGATMADVVRWIEMQEIEFVRTALVESAGLPKLVDAAALGADAARFAFDFEGPVRQHATDELRRAFLADGGRQARKAARQPESWPEAWRERLEAKVAADLDTAVRTEIELLLIRKGARSVAALAAAEALWAKEERLRSSIYATVQNILLGYADAAVADAAAGCDIDLDRWLSGPNTLYIVAPEHDQARLRPVLTVLLASAVRAAYDKANRNGGRLPRPLLALLDEAGNVAAPKDLPAWITTARSHAISLVTVWQDLAQIRALYGDLGTAILNNHKAKVFGSGISDPTTLDLVSRLVGERPQKERNRSEADGGRRSWTEHTTYRPLAAGDAIRRLDDHHAVLIYGNLPPARLAFRTINTEEAEEDRAAA
ncbi:MAG TPA: type IV secretory system conjugative DNA transfer family protein [Acidimicrobiia bacterium]|nr:type IV secretory system conjugative DNA transfer family protein [Acidimicrobiia bacterium]